MLFEIPISEILDINTANFFEVCVRDLVNSKEIRKELKKNVQSNYHRK
jgi:hypothetical protein